MSWAARLASGEAIEAPVAVVVAHPDDETLWTGSLLRRLKRAVLVVVTDGSPEDPAYARQLGFDGRAAYARERADELDAALDALSFAGRLVRYDVADQGAIHAVPAIAERLRQDLADAQCIVTHPYEGGHPDHDAVALAVSRLQHPAVVEFACYAQFDGVREWARFVPAAGSPEAIRLLDAEDRARVEAALAAHASQADCFGSWRPTAERWRAAPRYDFTRPPPGEACLYDSFGWPMTSAGWRRIASGASLPLHAVDP